MKAGMLALCLCAVPTLAAAQTMQWTDKGFVTVDVGAQVGSHNLDTTSSPTIYDEPASLNSTQKVKSGAFFDIGGAYRVWGRNLLAGVTISHTSSDSDVSINASIPDPLFFDRPRAVNFSQSGAKHSETAVHLDAIWMMPVANKIDVGFFAGPTIFAIKQDTVSQLTAANVTEPGPTVTAPLNEVKKTTAGFNFGADVQYMVAKRWGVGGVARYSWGSTKIDGSNDKLTVGGFQIGVGARLRF